MTKRTLSLLLVLALVGLGIAWFGGSPSVITVDPEAGRYAPEGREAQREQPKLVLVDASRLRQGTRYASFEDFSSDQQSAGFLVVGRFGGHWPATVSEIRSGEDGISFVRGDGTPHQYSGFDGYRMKMVRLEASGGRETIVVLRSQEKR